MAQDTVSTKMSHVLLENNVLMCSHGGIVQLKSVKGKTIKSDNIPIILESDLKDSIITGCSNINKPCTKVSLIPEVAKSKKKFNGEYVIVQDNVKAIMTDAGSPLQCALVPNRILVSSPVLDNSNSTEGKAEDMILYQPILSLMFSMLSADKVRILNTCYENRDSAGFDKEFDLKSGISSEIIEVNFDKYGENDDGMPEDFVKSYSSNYSPEKYFYKVMTLIFNYNIYEYIFLIPKGENNLLKKLDKADRKFGFGRFMDTMSDYNRIANVFLSDKEIIDFRAISGNVFMGVAGMESLKLNINYTDNIKVSDDNSNSNVLSYCGEKKLNNGYKLVILKNQYINEKNFLYSEHPEYMLFNIGKEHSGLDNIGSGYVLSSFFNNEIAVQNKDVVEDSLPSESSTEEDDDAATMNFLLSIVSNKGLDSEIKNFLSHIDNYIASNSRYMDLSDLKDLYDKVKRDSNNLVTKVNYDVNNLKNLREDFFKNFIIQECISLLVDFVSGKVSDKLFKKSYKIYKIMLKFLSFARIIPGAGVLFLAVDIAITIYSVYQRIMSKKEMYDKIVNRDLAFQLGREYFSLEAFYNNLTSELAYILLYNGIMREEFYISDGNRILMKTVNNRIRLLDECNANGSNSLAYNNVFVEFKGKSDVDINYISELFSYYNKLHVMKNSVVQLSSFDEEKNILGSSYYYHVKNLVLKGSIFNYIETNNFNSLLMYSLMDSSYRKDEEIINSSKYSLIISNEINHENIQSISQKMVLDKVSTLDNVLVLKVRNKYSLEEFFKTYESRVKYIFNHTNRILQDIVLVSTLDNGKIGEEINLYYNFLINIILNVENKYYLSDKFKNRCLVRDNPDAFNIDSIVEKDIYSFFKIYDKQYTEENNGNIKTFYLDISSIQDICSNFYNRLERFKENNKDINLSDTFLFSIQERVSELEGTQNYYDIFGIEHYLLNLLKLLDYIIKFISDLQSISSYFFPVLHSDDLKDNLKNVRKKYISIVEDFFSNKFKVSNLFNTDKNNAGNLFLAKLKQDSSLKAIYKQVVNTLYSENYAEEKENLIKNIEDYISLSKNNTFKDVHEELDYLVREHGISKCKKTLAHLYEYFYGTSMIADFHKLYLDEELYFDLFYSSINNYISKVLPVSGSVITYVCSDERYFTDLSKAIVLKYFNEYTGSDISKYMYTLLLEDSYIPEDDRLYNFIYLSMIISLSYYGVNNIFRSCRELSYTGQNYIGNEDIKYESSFIRENQEHSYTFNSCKYVDKWNSPSLQNTSLKDFINIVLYTLVKENIVVDEMYNNYIIELDGNIQDDIKDFLKDLFFDIYPLISLSYITITDKLKDGVAVILKKYLNSNNYIGRCAIIDKILLNRGFKVTRIYFVNIFYKEHFLYMHTQYMIFMRHVRKLEISSFSSTDIEKIKKIRVSDSEFFSPILSGALGAVVDKCLNDKYFKVIEVEEYNTSLSLIKYAFMSKRTNTPGAYWNIKNGYFTLPLEINQNFIMSDYTALVAGGQHFDNSFLIKGKGAGLFVQDMEQVSKVYIDKFINYFYEIRKDEADKKMGRYLIAYCNVITYLYNFSKSAGITNSLLEKYYNNVKEIQKEVLENEGIVYLSSSKEENENTISVNGRNYHNIDTLTMKEFMSQLKLVGESNYKYYENLETEKVEVEENKNYFSNLIVDKSNEEIPVLSGTLIYDTKWFNSKMK